MERPQRDSGNLPRSLKPVILIALGVVVIGGGLAVWGGYVDLSGFDEAWFHQAVDGLGLYGPLAMIGFMVLAIVLSPIPSGPIAMAAGALYGAAGGAFVSIAGAEIGAVMAFCLARYLGYDSIRRSENAILKFIAMPRSQPALMLIVFASRLIPFISFDAISYATGLTNLSFWRFALATLLGIVPISWLLAAMGAGLVSEAIDWRLALLAGCGITLIPALAFALIRRYPRRRTR